jgi:hypothetical protein
MPQPTITTQVHESLVVHRDHATQGTLDVDLGNLCPDKLNLGLTQVPDTRGRLNAGRLTNLVSARTADAVNLRQRDPGMLLDLQIDTRNASHINYSCYSLGPFSVNGPLYLNGTAGETLQVLVAKAYSALPLLVLLVTANYEQHAFAPYDFAVPTNLFNRSLHFHGSSP